MQKVLIIIFVGVLFTSINAYNLNYTIDILNQVFDTVVFNRQHHKFYQRPLEIKDPINDFEDGTPSWAHKEKNLLFELEILMKVLDDPIYLFFNVDYSSNLFKHRIEILNQTMALMKYPYIDFFINNKEYRIPKELCRGSCYHESAKLSDNIRWVCTKDLEDYKTFEKYMTIYKQYHN